MSFFQPPEHLSTELFLSNQKENTFPLLSTSSWEMAGPTVVAAFITHITSLEWSDCNSVLWALVAVYFYPKSLPFQDSQIIPRGLFSLYFFLTQWWFTSSSNFSWLSPFLITHVRIQAMERDWFLSHVARGKPRRCSMQAGSPCRCCAPSRRLMHPSSLNGDALTSQPAPVNALLPSCSPRVHM